MSKIYHSEASKPILDYWITFSVIHAKGHTSIESTDRGDRLDMQPAGAKEHVDAVDAINVYLLERLVMDGVWNDGEELIDPLMALAIMSILVNHSASDDTTSEGADHE